MLRSLAVFLAFAVALAVFSGCAGRRMPPLVTAQNVDLKRYMGTWHSIASFPKSFERGCRCTRAEYSLLEDGRVEVKNSCLRGGERDVATGVARLRKPGDTSRLEVSFFGPFWGEYSILHVDDGYRHAVVGTRDRDSLWFLAREPQVDEEAMQRMREVARRQGFDLDRLRPVEQDCAGPGASGGK